MRRGLVAGVVVLLASLSIRAQPAAQAPAFDVADVHVRAPSSNPNPFMTGGVLRGGRYDLRNATMLDLIRTAYDVDPDTVLGGPNWLEMDRFDIIAKAPNTTSRDTVRTMLQSLLADRFKLSLRKDTKAMDTYALTVVGAKPKMVAATGQGTPGCQPLPTNSPNGPIPTIAITCHNMTMRAFAQFLRAVAGTIYLNGPVIDMTGLDGAWDFDLSWSASRAQAAMSGGRAVGLFDAVQQQLGLKLDLQKRPTPVLVVESVNEKPTDNPSGVAQNLPPPPPAEFDVADIKMSAADARPNGRVQPGGRLDFQGFTLKTLMMIAWDINDDQLLGNAPKWLDSNRYNLLAKTSAVAAGGPAPGPAAGPQIDIDDVRLMLRALLIERFKLATHVEDRPVSAFALLASDKPKLTKADPANRTSFKEGPAAADAKDPRNTSIVLARLVTCRNMSMSQFAANLQRIAPGYVRIPVEDATGLAGSWDFTLSFSPIGMVQQNGAGRGAIRPGWRGRTGGGGSERRRAARRRDQQATGAEARDAQAQHAGARHRSRRGEARRQLTP